MLNGFNEQDYSLEKKDFNGFIYRGDLVDEKMQGQGQILFSNSDTYRGQLYNDMQQGKGVYVWANGDKYVGDFDKNLKHG